MAPLYIIFCLVLRCLCRRLSLPKMATNWWRVATNPNYLTDDELHAIMDADRLVLSLAPVSPQAIPETVTFCQVIGVMVSPQKASVVASAS